jgi:hypothetical protein
MGKSRPTAPPVPDPNQLIQQDAAQNRITQFTPYGNLLFGSVGDQGQFVQGAVPEDGMAAAFTQETPFQSQLRSQQEALGLGLATEAGQQFDQLAAQTPFELGLLQPEFTRQREALEQNLADRGLPIGGEAYNSAIDRLERQQGEQQQRLAQSADLAGGQEAQRLFNQASTARGQLFREAAAQGEFGLAGQQQAFGQQAANVAQQNAARQQQIADQLRANELNNMARQAQLNERIGLRGQQFNELAALLGGPQIQRPTFFAPSAINTLGANTLAQSAAANAFNQGMADRASGLGGLFDLAGSLGSAYLLR